ncbi:hypothetical protein [Haliea sp. E17]|uniref:hypothetical protein n=1 Tax=Haliea sp. E17 TaxID=3401576 RepID=UPI003AAB51CF
MKRRFTALSGALLGSVALADGNSVDRIYHPYVEQLAWELEWRMTYAGAEPATGLEDRQLHKLSLGHALSDSVFAEAYLVGEKSADSNFDIDAYEAEVLWQLSEQGEYLFDYGLLFEFEKEHAQDAREFSTRALLEKELGRFSATANIGLTYEWGGEIRDEFETSLSMQGRYRFSPRFEPALEWYQGENTSGLGPVMTGTESFGAMRSLYWEVGAIFGLDNDNPDYTIRALLEYEFL